jgi:hypothetical protein
MTGTLFYAWSGDACTSNPSSNKCQIDYSGTTLQSYTPKVTVTDSASPTPNVVGPISKPITFTAASSGGDGVPIPPSCPDGNKTITPKGSAISVFDGFPVDLSLAANQTAVYVVVVPPLPANTQVAFSWGQRDNATSMNVYASKTDACSTASQIVSKAQSGSVYGAVNDGQSGVTSGFPPKAHMQSGETWYISIKPNASTGCRSGGCALFLKPQIQS